MIVRVMCKQPSPRQSRAPHMRRLWQVRQTHFTPVCLGTESPTEWPGGGGARQAGAIYLCLPP